ncbi:hypothetical protein JTE90_012030 [Oedothorax gibbosus]|uniref:Uncharacterized protein n=1 Tax=Oedothorax gibbosus TaxID=931172 RepID=A0AAV6UE46_9ARAC|nr:hypothetical protein JTE90_012030 [Oedothorax gibbosus]
MSPDSTDSRIFLYNVLKKKIGEKKNIKIVIIVCNEHPNIVSFLPGVTESPDQESVATKGLLLACKTITTSP